MITLVYKVFGSMQKTNKQTNTDIVAATVAQAEPL